MLQFCARITLNTRDKFNFPYSKAAIQKYYEQSDEETVEKGSETHVH